MFRLLQVNEKGNISQFPESFLMETLLASSSPHHKKIKGFLELRIMQLTFKITTGQR